MLSEERVFWLCLNRNCGKTQACEGSEREFETRKCECGGVMKQETHATVFSYLNFLRESGSSKIEKKEEEEASCDRSMWTEQPCGERLLWP